MRIISGSARSTKLYTLEGMEITRPTLDRVKESVFNIVQQEIEGAKVLDLFAGSGAIGLEFASRGAKKVILCDKSKEAISVIKKNVEKTHLKEKVEIYNLDYKDCIKKIEEKMEIIYLDPPYKTEYIKEAIIRMLEKNIIGQDTKLIIETDDNERIEKEIEKIKEIQITDKRKYGRAHIIFAKRQI